MKLIPQATMLERSKECKVKDLLFIVYCHVKWQSNYCREFYCALAQVLGGKGRILCIDRPLALFPDIILKPGRLLKSLWKKRITKIAPNLTLYQPIIFLHDQIALSVRIFSRLNRWFIKRQLLKRFGRLFIDSQLFTYIIEPYQYDYIKLFENEISVYDCIAEWSSYPGLSSNEQKKRVIFENKTVNRVDVVFTVSQELYGRRKKIKDLVYYLPWAAEYEHFSRQTDLYNCADLLEYRRPYIGFIGNIWGVFNLDLVRHVAESFPDCSIILIGGLSDKLPVGFKKKFKEICLIENIHWLGCKEHNILPDYLQHFEVCIMPYIVDDWIKTCSPGKFYQYLAQGKPVISVDIPEIKKYDEDIVKIAKDYDDFIEKIKMSFKEDQATSLKLKRQKVAQENSWQTRVYKMLEFLKSTKVKSGN